MARKACEGTGGALSFCREAFPLMFVLQPRNLSGDGTTCAPGRAVRFLGPPRKDPCRRPCPADQSEKATTQLRELSVQALSLQNNIILPPLSSSLITKAVDNMPTLTQLVLLVLGFAFSASAQFQFFEQMFGGGGGGGHAHHHQQQAQNVPSDSGWYQQQYEGGMITTLSSPLYTPTSSKMGERRRLTCTTCSPLRQLPLPRYARLCPLPAPLPLRVSCRRRQGRVGRGDRRLCEQGRLQGGRGHSQD